LAKADVTKYITNPLNAYVLIKRTSSELQLVAKYLPSDLKAKFEKLWLYNEDMVGATEGLFRLQVTYRINSSDFANGIIMGQKVRAPFSPHDLFTIGKQALNLLEDWSYPKSEDFFAIEYMQMALNKIRNGLDPNNEVDKEEIAMTLASVYNKTGQFDKAAATVDFLVEFDPGFQELRNEYLALQREYESSKVYVSNPYDENFPRKKQFSWKTDGIYTNQACRGERSLTIKEQSQLRCRYISNSMFSKIGPFRAEELYLEPLIYLFYDVVFDDEIEVIKQFSNAKLQRGTNYNSGHSKGYSIRRITKTAFNEDHEHEVFKNLGRRVNVSF
jgi:prolyl 4-hydroxylase